MESATFLCSFSHYCIFEEYVYNYVINKIITMEEAKYTDIIEFGGIIDWTGDIERE